MLIDSLDIPFIIYFVEYIRILYLILGKTFFIRLLVISLYDWVLIVIGIDGEMYIDSLGSCVHSYSDSLNPHIAVMSYDCTGVKTYQMPKFSTAL